MIARMGSDGTTQRGADGELRGHDERHVGSCSHEAFFYDGHDQFMDGMMSFVTSALAAREPVLVVLSEPKLAAIRGQLDGDSANVLFADMGEVGTNPARIIPAWQGFIDAFGGRGQRLWGIGEPVWPGRSESELAECQRHELLLNLAFPDVPFSLLCPYDLALGSAVLEWSRRSHPFVRSDGRIVPSPEYLAEGHEPSPFDDALPSAPPGAEAIVFAVGDLALVRATVADYAAIAGLSSGRSADLMLAVSEICANSVRHGGGGGTLRLWADGSVVICEVADSGHIADPLAGRRRPDPEAINGRGMWLANQVCDLMQVRNVSDGTVVRLHMAASYAGSA